MRELASREVRHRVRGRQALQMRLRGLLPAVHRFGRCRAATDADRRWTAHRWIGGLPAASGQIPLWTKG